MSENLSMLLTTRAIWSNGGYLFIPEKIDEDNPVEFFYGDTEIMRKPEDTQVGGSHYKDKSVQPEAYSYANKLGWHEGEVVKYVTRWKDKGGVEDLKKAIHVLELLIAKVPE